MAADEKHPSVIMSCDRFVEIDDEQVELSHSQEAACPLVEAGNTANQTLHLLQSILDEFLADRAYWEPTPPSTYEVFRTLRDRLQQRPKA